MNNICHTPDLEQTFSCVENGGYKLVLKLTKPLTCMTVGEKSNSAKNNIYIYVTLLNFNIRK